MSSTMNPEKIFKENFIKIITSEDQTIGIYQAELFWKRRPNDGFKSILDDEISHEKNLIKFIQSRDWVFTKRQKTVMTFNHYIGWLIGTLLSILPRRICFYFHFVAEKQAASGYNDLIKHIESSGNPKLIDLTDIKNEIKKIKDNETLHSEIFKALMN